MKMCHFQVQNGPFVLNKKILVQTIIMFIYLLTLFVEQNLKEFLQQIQSYEMCHFWTQNGPSAPNNFFFGKLLISLSSTYQPLSLCKILKKFFQQILSYEDAQILGPKWPIFPNENFSRKPIELCFFHSCPSTCQKSKSDINPSCPNPGRIENN